MKLLYFTRDYTIHDRRFLQAFSEGGVAVAFATLGGATKDAGSALPNVEIIGNLGIPKLSSTSHLDAGIGAFERLVAASRPDIVLAGPLSDCSYIVSRARLDSPWVAQSWAFDVLWEAKRDLDAARRVTSALNGCDALFVDCNAVLSECRKLAARSLPNVLMMPWGLSVPEAACEGAPANQSFVEKLRIKGKRIFLHTRGLDEIYAPQNLLQAWAALAGEYKDVHLLLASDGPLRAVIEAQIESSGIGSSVSILGRVEHSVVISLFSLADSYVSFAACDGTSISLLEAMAAGVPCIVSDRGGNGEWISTGENGWVVPFADIKTLCGAMKEAYHLSPNGRERMAAISRRRLAIAADWSKNRAKLIAFLRGMIRVNGTLS